MDKLSPVARERITKSSTTRIKAKLEELGSVEADIEKMDKKTARDAWAQQILAGKFKFETLAGVAAPNVFDPELEKQRLAFEMKKWEAEMASKKQDDERAY